MEPLKLLLVSFREEWHNSLIQSLLASGYSFEVHHVSTKKQALFACYQSKYDILITNYQLPDGSSKDLVQVLGDTVACLVVSEDSTFFKIKAQLDQQYTEKSYRSLRHPKAWISTLKQVLTKWEKSVASRIVQGCHNRRLLFHKVAARCAEELYHPTENRVENALKVILDILEVSRIYVRDLPTGSSMVAYEISAPGQQHSSGPFSSVYEVPIRQADGGVSYLGVEDTIKQRVWDKAEIDLLKTVASLLRQNPEEIRHKMNMYGELGMTA
jgi:hypothetical protein